MKRRRQLFILLVGLFLLGLVTWLGSSLEAWLPMKTSPTTQSAQAGPYALTFQVAPNPPKPGSTADLSVQVVDSSTRQLVSHVHVVISDAMADMDMGTETATAREVSPGIYHMQAHFAMRGSWLIDVTISLAGQATEHAQFSVSAQ